MIATFDTLDELWIDAAQQILDYGHQVGSRDGGSREVLGYTARLSDPCANFMFNPVRRMNPPYAAAELLWYLSGDNSIQMIKAYAPQYERFVAGEMDDGEHANGAYGYRWQVHGQITDVVRQLTAKPDSRQAVMTCWDSRDLTGATYGGFNDIPCTLTLNFKLWDKRLYLTVTMRSNDVWLGLPYDVWSFTTLQLLIAYRLKHAGVDIEGLGWYQHQAMSMHLYDRNSIKVKQTANPPAFSTGGMDMAHAHCYSEQWLERALEMEAFNRKNAAYNKYGWEIGGSATIYSHLVAMAAFKWAPERVLKEAKGLSPMMRKYMKWLHDRRQ